MWALKRANGHRARNGGTKRRIMAARKRVHVVAPGYAKVAPTTPARVGTTRLKHLYNLLRPRKLTPRASGTKGHRIGELP
jgi:hypothetical protein